MKISLGNSRMDKHWKNTEMAWQELCDHVKVTKRTDETLEQFATLPKGQQDTVKDVGGFVGGHIKDGRRKKGNILSRSLLALDMDYATPDVWAEITMFQDFQCCIYTTHKHIPEHPRLRLLIPLSRDVTEDEYGAVGRMVAKEIGIDLFDDTTYEAARLMYWPSTSSDGEFLFEEKQGVLLDPDVFLGKYDDWKDVSSWPVSSRQTKILQNAIQKQADPLAKEGVVGAFCRTFSVQEAIDQFLEGVYSPSAKEGRYDYDLADSAAGVVVYEDKFIYSHHASDPASGRLLNAFDVVRFHKFHNEDEKTSFSAMNQFALGIDSVKIELVQPYGQSRATAEEDFGGLDTTSVVPDNKWISDMEFTKKGELKDSLNNFVTILQKDLNLQNIAYNKHRDGIASRGELPWEQIKAGWSDSDNSALKVYISETYGIYSPTKTKDAVLSVACERAYHPIIDFLDGLPEWDGVERIDHLLIDYFGAEDNIYTRAVIRKTMVAAVARLYEPGTKFDSVLILNGPQGIGKSTFFYKLAGEWFSDSLTLTDMKDKAGPEKLQGYWFLELGELAGMKKADLDSVKSFITRTDDKYRASYGVNVESHPRQCVIVGSTNAESGFLRDITGNRRFWPVRITGSSLKKAWDITREEVCQIWAEAVALYHAGEELYLKGEAFAIAENEQSGAMEADEREGLVRQYLSTPLPPNWSDLSIYERRNFLAGDDFQSTDSLYLLPRETVCNMEIWVECFGKDGASMKSADSYFIAAIMRKIDGWEKYKEAKNGIKVFPIYGRQRAYVANNPVNKS